jgi:antitoxin component YwqK of YwqJK toxin-antitoxin module
MLRVTKWTTALIVCLAWACEASLLQAQSGPQASKSPAMNGGRQASRPVDYVVEIPPEEDAAGIAPSPPDPQAMAAEREEQAARLKESEDGAAAKPLEEDTEVIKERYPNGATHIERHVTQDAQGNYLNHGQWKMWDQRGNLVAQGEYEYGNRTGVWIRWYRSVTEAGILSQLPYKQFPGPFISQAEFKNDLLDGLWTIYDGKTRKISQWSFAKGKRNGTSLWWYANGKKMREANFVDGDMEGQYLEWAPDGSLAVKENYEGGRKLALKTSHYKDGSKKSEGMYLFAKDVEHSPDDWWNCKLVTTVKSGKDEKHGTWTSWFMSKQKQLEGTYEHDVQVGQFTWWHSNGQRALQGSFDKGKQDGTWTWWHANGQKSIEGEYVKGNPTGRWNWWKEDGRVVQSADLSHSEGIVIDTPRQLDEQEPQAPRLSKPLRPEARQR